MPPGVLSRYCSKCGGASPASSPSCIHCAYPYSANFGGSSLSAKRVLGIVVALLFISAVLLIGSFHLLVKSSGAYREALQIATSSPDVQRLIGDGIGPKFPALGLTSGYHGSEFAEFSVRVTGSHGSGQLYGVANAVRGEWEFARLSFVADRDGGKIDLTPAPHRMSLAAVPAKKIYLIPMDLDRNESLEWAPTYYKAKFGIEVEVLPPTDIPGNLIDAKRKQVDSERLLEGICQSYSDICQDPANTLIAVTSRDIFIPSFGWRYAENFRHDAVLRWFLPRVFTHGSRSVVGIPSGSVHAYKRFSPRTLFFSITTCL